MKRVAVTAIYLACISLGAAGQNHVNSQSDPNPTASTMHMESGRRAYADEMIRDRQRHCQHGDNDSVVDACWAKQLDITEANYRKFRDSVRESLIPTSADKNRPGFPSTQTDAAPSFDKAERLWLAYRREQCGAVFDSYTGGTIAPTMGIDCQINLTRSHMRDLHLLYMSDPSAGKSYF